MYQIGSALFHENMLVCVFFFLLLLLVEKSNKGEKAINEGPQFTSGVILKITDSKPLPGRKFIKVQCNFSSSGAQVKAVLSS